MSKNFKLLLLFLAPLSITAQEVEEVIVTANKKAETVMEIPMNISVITEATLDERGILNPEDYLRSIAGVSTPGGSNYYTFRGLNTSTSQRSSGTTSTYVDEINGSLMNLLTLKELKYLEDRKEHFMALMQLVERLDTLQTNLTLLAHTVKCVLDMEIKD